jgi:hypothetical protein
MGRRFELTGLDGANPLGFLAALGTLVSLHEARIGNPKLSWRAGPHWVPLLHELPAYHEEELAQLVTGSLKGAPVAPKAEARRARAQRDMETAHTTIKKKREEIKKRRLRGAERSKAIEQEIRPLEKEYERKRREWLAALREAVPRPELALGKRIDCTAEEYHAHASALVAEIGSTTRGALDLLAAFGSDACRQPRSDAIEPSPFCFITGSGHQFFLETAQKLLDRVTTESVRRTLFDRWDYRDEKLSMRWDPLEDRRYALLNSDPSDTSVRTVWMANLLGYRALALFPTAPMKGRLAAAGWNSDHRHFTWPIWDHPLGADAVRSLVQLRELVAERPDPGLLSARGVAAAFRSSRLEVGQGVNRKLNFSPARQVASVRP